MSHIFISINRSLCELLEQVDIVHDKKQGY